MPFTSDQVDKLQKPKEFDSMDLKTTDGRSFRINFDGGFAACRATMPDDPKERRAHILSHIQAYSDGLDTWLYYKVVEMDDSEAC
jgi:hypothetical protein